MGIPSRVKNSLFFTWSSSKSTSLHRMLTVGPAVVSTCTAWSPRVFAAKGDLEPPWCSILSLMAHWVASARLDVGRSQATLWGSDRAWFWSQSSCCWWWQGWFFPGVFQSRYYPGSYHAYRKTSGRPKIWATFLMCLWGGIGSKMHL